MRNQAYNQLINHATYKEVRDQKLQTETMKETKVKNLAAELVVVLLVVELVVELGLNPKQNLD